MLNSSRTLPDRARSLAPPVAYSLLRGLAPFVACVALAFVLHVFIKPQLQDYNARLVLDIGVNIMLAVSLTIVNGFTGQFSMGHAGFMAVGGYAAGIVTFYGSIWAFGSFDAVGGALSGMPRFPVEGAPWLTQGDGLFLLALIVGGCVAAALGYLVGLPSLRLRGDYLAIVTLGFGEIVRVLITRTNPVPSRLIDPAQPLNGQIVFKITRSIDNQQVDDFVRVLDAPLSRILSGTGGALGFSDLPTYTSLFWVFLWAFITLLVAYRIKRSTFGRAFLSIREDEIASEAMGVNTTRYKIRAFVISAFFAGVAGGLFAHTIGVGLTPQAAGFQKSFDIIIMVVLGGMGSISGATIAAIVVTLLPEYLRDIKVGIIQAGWLILGLGVFGAAVSLFKASITRRQIRTRTWVWLGAAGVLAVVAIGLGLLVPSWASANVQLGNIRMIIFSLALIPIMIFRPQGLLGVRELWDKALWKRSAAKRRSARRV